MKTRIKLLIGIIIILVLYFILFSYYVKKYRTEERKPIEAIPDLVTVDKILNFIADNKIVYLDSLNTSLTNKNINSEELLKYAYYVLVETEDFKNGVETSKLDKVIKDAFGSKIKYKYVDINFNKKSQLKYLKDDDKYVLEGDNIKPIISAYDYVINYESRLGKYILTVNKIFIKDNKAYATVNDLNKTANSIFDVKTSDLHDYLQENHDSLNKYLEEYEYTFTKENGNIVILKYQIKNKAVKKPLNKEK